MKRWWEAAAGCAAAAGTTSVTFTEHHLWPQAIAFATMNTSLLNTCSHAEYFGGHVVKPGAGVS